MTLLTVVPSPPDDDWDHTTPEPPADVLDASLARTKKGEVAPIASNIAILICQAPDEWSLRYDEFRDIVIVEAAPTVGGLPSRLGDLDDYLVTVCRHWLCEHKIEAGAEETLRGMVHAAKQSGFDPLKAYLRCLQWDGVRRIDSWLQSYLGAADEPVIRAMGRMWLISAVARGLDAGCKVDHMLVLIGAQGDRKTSALETLCPDARWFQPEIPDLKDKDAMQLLRGIWIACMDEMASMRKADVLEIAKNYITRRADRYRASYGRMPVNVPRRCVFAGTSNPKQILTDPTGNRRFWCVEVGRVDLDGIKRDRDQLWAEAVTEYQEGRQWWPDHETASSIRNRNVEYTAHDEWQKRIEEICESNEFVTIGFALGDLGIATKDWTQADQNRVAKILTSIGRVRSKRTINGVRVWGYVRPQCAQAADPEPVVDLDF